MLYVTRYDPDFDSLREASTRIVVAGGADSEGTFPTAPRWPWPSDLRPKR